jgi:hypothetical protein
MKGIISSRLEPGNKKVLDRPTAVGDSIYLPKPIKPLELETAIKQIFKCEIIMIHVQFQFIHKLMTVTNPDHFKNKITLLILNQSMITIAIAN